jgi:hypothetical protein
MPILDDGTIIPSYLGTEPRGVAPNSNSIFNDGRLQKGEIKEIIYPDDARSISKRFIEYEVEVQHYNGSGIVNTTTYHNVTTLNGYGTQADYDVTTYRQGDTQSEGVGTGSKVLIQCIGGDMGQAIIVGGRADIKYDPKPIENVGHSKDGEFNGIHWNINKDGELSIKFRGATNADGTLADSADTNAEGTILTFSKEGNLTLATPKNAQFLKLNHKDKKIEFLADSEWSVKVNDKATFNIQNDFNLNSTAGNCSITAASNIKLKSSGVLVGAATDNWIKGSTYRQQEAIMHNKLAAALAAVSAAVLTAATGLSTGTPPGIAAAGAALQTAGPMLLQASNAILAMEALSSTYLSLVNKAD